MGNKAITGRIEKSNVELPTVEKLSIKQILEWTNPACQDYTTSNFSDIYKDTPFGSETINSKEAEEIVNVSTRNEFEELCTAGLTYPEFYLQDLKNPPIEKFPDLPSNLEYDDKLVDNGYNTVPYKSAKDFCETQQTTLTLKHFYLYTIAMATKKQEKQESKEYFPEFLQELQEVKIEDGDTWNFGLVLNMAFTMLKELNKLEEQDQVEVLKLVYHAFASLINQKDVSIKTFAELKAFDHPREVLKNILESEGSSPK